MSATPPTSLASGETGKAFATAGIAERRCRPAGRRMSTEPFQHDVPAGGTGGIGVRGNAVTRNVMTVDTARAPVRGAQDHVLKKVHWRRQGRGVPGAVREGPRRRRRGREGSTGSGRVCFRPGGRRQVQSPLHFGEKTSVSLFRHAVSTRWGGASQPETMP